ncbi:MAG: hypothetical protein RI988_3192 [Pseudomonadota bacterium]|jgi:PST family polysaccharide transporter
MRPRASRLRRGIAWSGAHLVATRGLAMLTRIGLAALLAPEQFGLFAMVAVSLGLVTTLADFGLQGALVQRAGAGRQALASSAFWFLAGTGAALTAGAALAGAPLLGHLYGEPRLLGPAQALSAGILLSALAVVPTSLLLRQGRVARLVVSEFAGVAVGAAAAFSAATAGLGVWSLVAQQLAAGTLTFGLVWWQSGWRPAFRARWSTLRSLMPFSLSMTGTKAVTYVRMNLDNLFVGALHGAAALGVYALAFTFTEGLRSQVATAASRVMLPVYSQHQHAPDVLREHYLRATRVMLLALAPLALAAFLYAQPLCSSVLGPGWADAVKPMQILAVGGLLHAASGPAAEVLQALGRPQLLFRMAWRNLLGFALPCMAALTWWHGAEGAAYAYTLTVATQRVMLHRALAESIGLQARHVLGAIAGPLGLCAGVLLMAHALRPHTATGLEAILTGLAYLYGAKRLIAPLPGRGVS